MHKILILSATHTGDMKSVENSKQCSFAWLPPDARQPPQPPGNRLLQMCFRCARISFFGMPFAIARHSNTGNTTCQTKAKWSKHPTRRSDFQKYSEQKERKKRAVVLRQQGWAALDEEFKSHFLTSVAPWEGRREGGLHAAWAGKPRVCVCVCLE